MKGLMLVLVLIFLFGVVDAQESGFTALVTVESAHVRAEPVETAESVASLYNGDELLVVGRNLDGTWFEVRRPGRLSNIGWVDASLLHGEFHAEDLPMTDTVTGMVGDTPVNRDPGFAGFILRETEMRQLPFNGRRMDRIIPVDVTVPVRGRNQNGSWLLVNYLGTEGWVSAFDVREIPGVMEIPEIPGLPPISVEEETFVIPPQVQLNEIVEFKRYILSHYDFTYELEAFWAQVFRGDVMPCEPPPFVQDYLYSRQDARAFPELEFLVPRLGEGIGLINESIDAMYTCGAVNPRVVIQARNDSINARFVFDATLSIMDNIESRIRDR
jgi:hypothetical protein